MILCKYLRENKIEVPWLVYYLYDDELIVKYDGNGFLLYRDGDVFVLDSFELLDTYLRGRYGLQEK